MKKGSLSLSIDAVVILVMAITLLGLGLGFTKKMFTSFGDTLEIPIPELTATESEPIVLMTDNIIVKKDKYIKIPVKFYSTDTGEVYAGLWCHDSRSLWHDGACHTNLQSLSNFMQFFSYTPLSDESWRWNNQLQDYLSKSQMVVNGGQYLYILLLDKSFMREDNSVSCTLKFKITKPITSYWLGDQHNLLLAEKQITFAYE